MSDLIGFEVPKIDWTQGPDLVQRFRRFKQKCELLFEGPLKPRTDEQKCKYLLLWTGDYGLDLFNTWNLSEEQQKHLHEYWTRLEEHVKPQSNYILNRFYLRSLKQNNRPLDEFLTEAKLLIQNSGYPADSTSLWSGLERNTKEMHCRRKQSDLPESQRNCPNRRSHKNAATSHDRSRPPSQYP